MPSFRQVAIGLLLSLTLVSCRRDPNTAKKHYLDSGNKYFDKGLYKPAKVQYLNALKIDPKYGVAHYKLAVLYMKETPPEFSGAYREYRRAAELLKENQAYQEEYKQTIIKLSELTIQFLPTNEPSMKEVQDWIEQLFKKDPNSFDAFRLSGDYQYARALLDEKPNPPQMEQDLNEAMGSYQKADAIKPNDPAVTMEIGLILAHQKQYAAAEGYLRKVVAMDKTSTVGIDNLYRLYMTEQKTADAEQVLKDAIQNNPKSYLYLERLAFHYGSLGRREDMLSVLQQIKARAKDFEGAYQVVGDFYLRTGDAESALREYREGMVKDPKRKSNYQHAVVEVLLRQGKRAEAAEVNAQVLKENPKDADAQSLAATFLLDQGDIASATSKLQSVVTSSPENAVAHYQLGRAYLASGKADSMAAARQQFQMAIERRPDMISPRLGMAELQNAQGEFQGALETVQDILKRDPGNLSAKIIQSQALVGQQKYAESDSLLATMVKSNPSNPDVFYQSGVSALAQHKTKDAEAAFMRSYELNPANARGLMGAVQAYIEENKTEVARSLLDGEAKKYPNRLDIVLLQGTTANREGKYSEALAFFTRVLNGLDKKSKTRADLYMQIANTYRLAGDREQSIVNLTKAREILPDNEIILSGLGLLLDMSNKKAEARQAYEAALKVNPNAPLTLNNLAYLMAESNSDLDIALNYAQKAKQLSPNTPEISDTYGWILLKKNLPEQAIPVFKGLVDRYSGNSTYHYHLAMAYSQRGESPRAMDELREAMKHTPPKDEQQKIQDMIGKLGRQ